MWITVDRKNKIPFIRQIYNQLRQKILSGEYPAGEKLPSTRELSISLKVSRNVVLEAYQLPAAMPEFCIWKIDSHIWSRNWAASGGCH